jgi:hypothetical protein
MDWAASSSDGWKMKSSIVSCYMCWLTLRRWSRIRGKFSTNLFQYAVTILHPTPLFLVGSGNFFVTSRIWYPYFTGCGTREARFHLLVQIEGTVQFSSYLVRHSKLLVRSNNITIYPAWACRPKLMRPSVTSWDRLQCNGFAYRVKSFTVYDMNRYHFHTASYEQNRSNRRTTNSGVCMTDTDGLDYYGRIEEIYELSFHGGKPLNPVIFKCH